MIFYGYALKDPLTNSFTTPIFLTQDKNSYLEKEKLAIKNKASKLNNLQNLELYYLGKYDDSTAEFIEEKEYLLTYPAYEKTIDDIFSELAFFTKN